MKILYPENSPQFFTSTIQSWKHLLKDDKYKEVVITSLQFLKENKKVKVNAFVIMDNHIHLNWQAMPSYTLGQVQTAFKNSPQNSLKSFWKMIKNWKIMKLMLQIENIIFGNAIPWE